MGSTSGFGKKFSMIALAILCGICALWLPQWLRLWGALPMLQGTVDIDAISAPVSIVRDAAGVPSIEAGNRADSAFALGFVHSQERFFQMDLLRRQSAGQLSALIGQAGLDSDQQAALYNFSTLATQVVQQLPPAHAALLQAYTDGVNAGLSQLNAMPAEYAQLNTRPEPWQPQDSVLVAYSLFLTLQGQDLQRAVNLHYLQAQFPPALVSFLVREIRAGQPDAATPAVPAASVLNLRDAGRQTAALPPFQLVPPQASRPSGIGWVMSGQVTGHTTIVTDMNLLLSMPNLWFRASQRLTGAAAPDSFDGLTIPGLPMFLAGSNGHVAWGLSVSASQWGQLIPADAPDSARTARQTTIEVHQGDSIRLDLNSTAAGPVIPLKTAPRAGIWHWAAHTNRSINFGLFELETATTTAQALAQLAAAKFVHFDAFVGDSQGQIGWTLLGDIPAPACQQNQAECTPATNTSQPHPQILNPAKGYISVADLPLFNHESGLFDWPESQLQPRRVRQTKDQLFVMYRPDPQMAFRALVDTRNRSMRAWQTFMLNLLSAELLTKHPHLQELRRLVDDWNGDAAANSSGYLLIRAFRDRLTEQVFLPLLAPVNSSQPALTVADYQSLTQHWEDVLWQITQTQPVHLLAPSYQHWGELFTTVLLETDFHVRAAHPSLQDVRWGLYNAVELTHQLARLWPWPSSAWWSVPRSAGSGDLSLSKTQLGNFGATLRAVISPGQEASSLISMPLGQAGNPLSPYWLAGHDAWATETPQAFLPGAPSSRLILNPTHSDSAKRSDHARDRTPD